MSLTKEQLQFFARYIEANLGIQYAESNYFQLENRLEEIAKYLGKKKEDILVSSYDKISGDFKRLLLDISTNNETSFFRDSKVFEVLQNVIIPKFINKQTINVWSAACSYGQEPYSLAMIFSELAKKHKMPPVSIVATDVSERVLDRASKGLFTHLEVQRGLPAKMLIEYFKPEGEMWKANSQIRNMISFRKLNLLESWAHALPFDLILCRNVLIYQSVDNKKKVIAKMSRSLNSQGVLVLGAAESMMGLSTDFYTQMIDGVALQIFKNSQLMSA